MRYENKISYYITSSYIEVKNPGYPHIKKEIEHGRYRKTLKAAKQALALNKRVNRLHALVEQLGGLKEFVVGEKNYGIYFYRIDRRWSIEFYKYRWYPVRVYMTEECATEICRMLNAGEFEL